MSAIEDARRVAADMLRQVGDEEGARVVDRLSWRWEAYEQTGRPGRFNVVLESPQGHLKFAPGAPDSQREADAAVRFLNLLTCGVEA